MLLAANTWNASVPFPLDCRRPGRIERVILAIFRVHRRMHCVTRAHRGRLEPIGLVVDKPQDASFISRSPDVADHVAAKLRQLGLKIAQRRRRPLIEPHNVGVTLKATQHPKPQELKAETAAAGHGHAKARQYCDLGVNGWGAMIGATLLSPGPIYSPSSTDGARGTSSVELVAGFNIADVPYPLRRSWPLGAAMIDSSGRRRGLRGAAMERTAGLKARFAVDGQLGGRCLWGGELTT